MFKNVCRTLASLLVVQSVNAANPEISSASDLPDLANTSLALLPPRPLSFSAETKVSGSVNHYQYKHAFKAHQRKTGISKLSWESENLNSHVSAKIDSEIKPISLELEYITSAEDGIGKLTDYDYYNGTLIARTESAGTLSPKTTINATLSRLTFAEQDTKLFQQLTVNYTESSHYLAEDVLGFTGTQKFSDGTGPSDRRVYYYYPDTRANSPLEFNYKEIQVIPGIRLERLLSPETTFSFEAGAGPSYRAGNDYHNWKLGGRDSTTDTFGITGLLGGNLEIKFPWVKVSIFCSLLNNWSYGELDQGASGENKANSSPIIDGRHSLTSGIYASGKF